MNSNSSTRSLRSADDGNARLCLCAAAALFATGMVGRIANFVSPGTTNLDALLAVSAFYFVLAIIDARVSARIRAKQKEDTLDDRQQVTPSSHRRAA